jgi:FtsP/CotA-like multicopper oxidase with cupredoxin domain
MEFSSSSRGMRCRHILLVVGVQIFFAALSWTQTVLLPYPPQVRAKNQVVSLTLRAVNEDGRDAFAFDGGNVAPVIRASPGDVLNVTYINDLPAKSSETCAVNPCMDMTNLHFHGLTVSPNSRPMQKMVCPLRIPHGWIP